MSELLDVAKAQFRDRMGGALNSVEVPEWNTTIYFKPCMSFKQQGEVLNLASQGKQAEAIAMTFITRSLDENGKGLFKRVNMTEIMNQVDPDVISRVVSAMGGDDLEVEDAVKN
jgi:hypothetical protein